MLLVFSIIFENGTAAATGFFSQPFDVILLQILFAVGWIPIFIVLVWGFGQVWLDIRKDEYKKTMKWILLAIDVPRLSEQSPKAMENVFTAISGTASTPTWKDKWVHGMHSIKSRFSFELVSEGGYIQYYIRCRDRFRDLVEASIYAQYPDAEISVVNDYVDKVPTTYPNEYDWHVWGTELKLKKLTYFPLRTWMEFEHMSVTQGGLKDPLAVMLEQLSRFQIGEQLWIQIVLEPGNQDWKDEAEAYIKEQSGEKAKPKASVLDSLLQMLLWLPSAVVEAFTQVSLLQVFGYGPEEVKKDEKPPIQNILRKNQTEAVAKKAQKVGLHCKIRVLYFGKTAVFKRGWRVAMIKGIFQQFAKQDVNSFVLDKKVTPQDDYFWLLWSHDRRLNRLVEAYKKRDFTMGTSSFVLNTEELASIFHFPSIDIKAPLVKKTESRRAEPPAGLPMAREGERDIISNPVFFTKKEEPTQETIEPSSPVLSLPELRSQTDEPVVPWDKEEEKIPEDPDEQTNKKDEQSNQTKINLPPLSFGSIKETQKTEIKQEQKRKIPEAMRVLLEPGVELEDVGISQTGQDRTDDSPSNLPL